MTKKIEETKELDVTTLNIYQRLHGIMSEVAYIQKEDKKVNGEYRFVSHDAVTAEIHKAFVKWRVFAKPEYYDISQRSVTGLMKDANVTVLVTSCKCVLTFINIDKPEDAFKIDCAGFGDGIDRQDKGAGKAMSYAYKYAILKAFALETGDDPEKDSIDIDATTPQKIKAEQIIARIQSCSTPAELETIVTLEKPHFLALPKELQLEVSQAKAAKANEIQNKLNLATAGV